ncbi:MAG: helix-turn-helix transcriptional regulator [Bacteroidetes bacterium]|nr:helix-turn-helix transcriptional regulator [Bacteroidota bacterium]
MIHKPLEIKTLSYKGKVVFEKLTMTTFKRIPKLFKDNEACFMYINKGEFSVRTQNEFISFKKGKGLLAKCFNYFSETTNAQREKSETLEITGILLHQDILREIFPFNISPKQNNKYNIKKVEIDALLFNFKESINILLDNPSLTDEPLILNKLKEFILLISKTDNAPSELEFLSGIFTPVEYDFKSAIENNLYSDLSLNEFARLCNMSLATFNRKFREVYMQNPRKYFTEKKIKKASEMLSSQENRIADIAFECGFESISTFNRVFKTHFEKSPSKYRLT